MGADIHTGPGTPAHLGDIPRTVAMAGRHGVPKPTAAAVGPIVAGSSRSRYFHTLRKWGGFLSAGSSVASATAGSIMGTPHSSALYQSIHRQPEVLREVLRREAEPARQAAEILAGARRVYLAGTGTSSHAAFATEYLYRSLGLEV